MSKNLFFCVYFWRIFFFCTCSRSLASSGCTNQCCHERCDTRQPWNSPQPSCEPIFLLFVILHESMYYDFYQHLLFSYLVLITHCLVGFILTEGLHSLELGLKSDLGHDRNILVWCRWCRTGPKMGFQYWVFWYSIFF